MGSIRTGWVVAVAALLLAAACSSPASVNTDPIVVTTVPTTPAPTTTAAPTTSAAPTTAAAPTTTVAATTTTTVDDTEAAILEAVAGFFESLTYDLNTGESPDPDDPRHRMFATGRQLELALEIAASERALGRTWQGSFEYRVVDVAPEASIAAVVVCIDDQALGLEADGVTVFDEPEEQTLLDTLSLVMVDSAWKVSEWFTSGDSCDTVS